MLLGADVSDPAATSLMEMTCGEVGSGVNVLLLGESRPGVEAVAVKEPAMLAGALAWPDVTRTEAPHDAPLEAEHALKLMNDGCVRVRFQPIVRFHDRSVVALEVLARLHRARCSILPPNRFVPQIEHAGFGAELLRRVVREAFSTVDALDGATLALNLSLDVLRDRGTADMLAAERERAGIPAVRILLELTETQVVSDVSSLDNAVAWLRDAGYGLAIDDAGPEVPQHRAMFALPFDWVKLDKGVVTRASQSAEGRRYMADLIESAHRENLSVVAEGIEHDETWDMAAELGADCAQGFMIARPLPAIVVPLWRAAWDAIGGSRLISQPTSAAAAADRCQPGAGFG